MLPSDLNKEFIKWHYRLGYMSYKTISIFGILPKKLKDCDTPTCATCIFGGMIKKSSRLKPLKLPKDKSTNITCPGQCISVDQMEIKEECLITQ